MRNLTVEEKARLAHVIEQGVNTLQEIAEMRESMKEDVTAVADNLEVKVAIVNKAIRVAYKRNMSEMKTAISDVEDLLAASGRKI